ncbi:hypothetical protein SLEP1_g26852 [Rubroshorea leprosula]|uniref:Uncharacterized protein n=1 Tax=Rubroshorea leprosula TaxID=152421 RepID=A0AAV5JZP8_9ROSI|nr:hypothetical protein SLEP1_g26852 [Rubroshorea leprosula]
MLEHELRASCSSTSCEHPARAGNVLLEPELLTSTRAQAICYELWVTGMLRGFTGWQAQPMVEKELVQMLVDNQLMLAQDNSKETRQDELELHGSDKAIYQLGSLPPRQQQSSMPISPAAKKSPSSVTCTEQNPLAAELKHLLPRSSTKCRNQTRVAEVSHKLQRSSMKCRAPTRASELKHGLQRSSMKCIAPTRASELKHGLQRSSMKCIAPTRASELKHELPSSNTSFRCRERSAEFKHELPRSTTSPEVNHELQRSSTKCKGRAQSAEFQHELLRSTMSYRAQTLAAKFEPEV